MGRTSGQVVARKTPSSRLRDRHREQRKKIIKMCVKKLRDIDDPETVLCRAVLINNTFRTLKTAQRQLLRNARRRIEQRESSEEEESEEEEEKEEDIEDVSDKKKKEEKQVVEVESSSAPRQPPLPSLKSDPGTDSLEEIPGCDLGCSESALVHSLIMPPLLSPHIEDMTNCSFYDSFGPVELGGQDETQMNTSDHFHVERTRENMSTSLKITMMKSNICDVIQDNNSNSSEAGYHQFQKSEFGGCGAQGESGDSLLDNLLTEIAQA